MPFLHWAPNLSVGVEEIDADHRQLVEHLNALFDAVEGGEDQAVVAQRLEALIEATRQHFAREEGMMQAQGYPDFEHHKRVHEALLQEIAKFRDGLESGQMEIGRETPEFLKTWLIGHILESDKHLGGYLEAKLEG